MASSTSPVFLLILSLIAFISCEDSPLIGNHTHHSHDHQEDRQFSPQISPQNSQNMENCILVSTPTPINNMCIITPHCQTECKQVPERVCQPMIKQQCQEFNVTVCNDIEEQVCETFNITRLDNQCEFKNVEECNTR